MDISELTESYFKLTPYEKRAFHLVTNLAPRKKKIKYFGSNEKFSVEYFYRKLVETHGERVRKRKLRRKDF